MIEHHSNKYPFGLRQFGFFGVLLLLVFSNFMFAHSLSWEKTATIFLAEILTLLIIGLFSLKNRYLLFEPIVVFSAYYFTIIPTAIYYIYTDFSTSIIVNSTTFNNNTSSLLLSAMAYYVFGYIFALAGYYLVRTKKIYTIDFESKLSLPDSILNAVIIVFITVGLVNFFRECPRGAPEGTCSRCILRYCRATV